MSEVEKKLEGVLTEYAKMDDGLRDMYVRLRELDSISENYGKTKTFLEASSSNLKATSDALISEIEVLKDLTKILGNGDFPALQAKLEALEEQVRDQQVHMISKLKGEFVALEAKVRQQILLIKELDEKFEAFEVNIRDQQNLLVKFKSLSIGTLILVSSTLILVFISMVNHSS